MDIYTHNGNKIVPISMSATARDISSKLVVVRNRLLTRNAPITSELPNTIMTASTQKKTLATMSSVVISNRGPPGPAPDADVAFSFVTFHDVAFSFVTFQDVVFSAIARHVVCRNN